MGIATTRYEERVFASLGKAGHAPVIFEPGEGLCGAGVLFLLPALLEQGLLRTKEVYQFPASYYYSLESVVLTLAFMALARIRNPEQLKQCKPGEIGRIIGLDRVPEVRCLREKIKLLTKQNKARSLNNLLIDQWYGDEQRQDGAFLYIDGHIRIYYGTRANLPAKYVSRQKLCLSATTEYWVNDAQGMPVMMVMGELTEKLQTAIEDYIIPQLQQSVLLKPVEESHPGDQPQCTFIFDREAYEPAFFRRLWQQHRIAIITYRKNVKDNWEESSFKPIDTQILNNTVIMYLCEKETELGGCLFREIRKLNDNHQTAIITTHPTLEMSSIAGRMFTRWTQENFFRYLMADYELDKMIEFGVETIDPEQKVVNPEYRKANHRLKKLREKISRLEAKFYPLAEQAMDQAIDQLPEITRKQAQYKEILDQLKKQEAGLLKERNQHPAKVKLKEMPEKNRYNKLKTESKLLINVIKMICYRAESALASLAVPYLSRSEDEKRMFIKQIIQNHADLIPDYEQNTLTVVLHSLSAPRFNLAAQQLTQLLNETETVFPGTNMRMIFKTTALSNCER
jgi:hypothetical protein